MKFSLPSIAFVIFVSFLPWISTADPAAPSRFTTKAAMQRLKEGHERFLAEVRDPSKSARSRVRETAKAQYPFASVLSCADSRVPPEIIFDQGIGDIFVVRTAGPVLGDYELGSLEYSALKLGAPLIVVLGHTGCGAVQAAVEEASVPGEIASIVRQISKAVEVAKKTSTPAALMRKSVEQNIAMVKESLLEQSEVLKDLVDQGKLRIVGAVYETTHGRVTWLDEPHP